MERMQAMTEMNLVEICHRITQVERALTCTKEFSIKFNGHLKLITSLVNSLYEEEESLILFEQKIEKRVDHYHKRIFFRRERNGEERVILEDEEENKGGWGGIKGEYDGFDQTDGINDRGKGLVGTWNGDRMQRKAYTTQRGTDGMAQSMEDGLNPMKKKMGKMEIRSEYQGNKGYRKDMENLGEGKRGALVNDFRFATVDSVEENNQRTSEDIAMSRKLDMFMKESDLLKEVIKNGESNAKHLKECLFKLIDAFKDQNNNSNQKKSEKRVEKVEKIIREKEVRGY
jgi:hypothetical protein